MPASSPVFWLQACVEWPLCQAPVACTFGSLHLVQAVCQQSQSESTGILYSTLQMVQQEVEQCLNITAAPDAEIGC